VWGFCEYLMGKKISNLSSTPIPNIRAWALENGFSVGTWG